MQLHHSSGEPDWITVPEAQRSRWQTIAHTTRGIVTPGNIISFVGLLVSFGGLYLFAGGENISGALLLGIGRLLDVFDGYAAAWTKTKSPQGAAVDASFDKVIALAALTILTHIEILPLWVAIGIGIQSTANIVLALIARQRFVQLRPSRAGKNAVFGFWLAILLFVISALLANQVATDTIHMIAAAGGYGVAIAALLIGIAATYGYIGVIFSRHAEKYLLLDRFTRYIIITNPASIDAYKATDRIQEIRELAPDSELIMFDTIPGGSRMNAPRIRQLADKLGEQTLVCIAGGDGTANMIIDILMRDPLLPDSARLSPILPLWCGNANDLAYILSGWPTAHPIHKVMRHAGLIAVKPMLCTLHYVSGETTTRIATCYASFGASAFATKEMEHTLRAHSPIRRFGLSRLGQEFFAASWALLRAPTFAVSENGQTHIIFERTHLNGSRFAKVIGVPLRLTDERFHRATIARKHPVTFLLHILGLVGDRDLAKKTITCDAFTVHDDVWAQFDGEAVRIPSGTEIEVTIARQSFYALSTRLNR